MRDGRRRQGYMFGIIRYFNILWNYPSGLLIMFAAVVVEVVWKTQVIRILSFVRRTFPSTELASVEYLKFNCD